MQRGFGPFRAPCSSWPTTAVLRPPRRKIVVQPLQPLLGGRSWQLLRRGVEKCCGRIYTGPESWESVPEIPFRPVGLDDSHRSPAQEPMQDSSPEQEVAIDGDHSNPPHEFKNPPAVEQHDGGQQAETGQDPDQFMCILGEVNRNPLVSAKLSPASPTCCRCLGRARPRPTLSRAA